MAAPNPERELQRLRRTLEQGMPPVVVVSGMEAFFREEAMALLRAAVPGDADLRTVDGQQETDGRELDDLRGGGLFGSGSWLIVRRGDGWLKTHGDGLLAALEKLGGGCGLVLEVQKLDKRTKRAKALLARAEGFEFRTLYAEPYDRSRSPLEAELVGWIVQRGRGMGVPLTAEAAFLLATVVGQEPAELVAELERLNGELGERKGGGPLGPEEVRGLLHASFGSTPFELAEAVLGGDRVRAERSLQAMYARGVKGRDGGTVDSGGVFPFATSWLFQSLGQCLEGRLLVERGVAPRDVPARLGVRAFADRFLAQVRRNEAEHLRRGMVALLEAQRGLRVSGEDPEWLLRRFLARWFRDVPAGAGR